MVKKNSVGNGPDPPKFAGFFFLVFFFFTGLLNSSPCSGIGDDTSYLMV